MKDFILTVVSSMVMYPAFADTDIPLKKGLVITTSVGIKQDSYSIAGETSVTVPLIIIEGKNITVDFHDAVLKGTNNSEHPDQFNGLAILIRKGSEHITLKNANIHGYKVAVMADNVTDLIIENCDFSYNYRQHLHSNREREDISDWMSYHHNENDEWLRYGAGIYIKDCSHAIVRNNTIINGQCGLKMMRCSNTEVYDNNFSYNSGIGIGMYRSSNNNIYHNRLDFNVRGFSFGKYYRGQDSAGFLVFEQCSNNVFAYNSATHSGDGFFLWAGQYTMDTGEGGCNDNLIYGNDFSYAPTNGVEVTFSRNRIEENIIKECDHGIWGGYSYQTIIRKNQFEKNRIAVAIEHGQDNEIFLNDFKSDKTAIKLWSRKEQPTDWVYAQKRDTRSVDYTIMTNNFTSNNLSFDILGTDSIVFDGNLYTSCDAIYQFGERVTNIDTSEENSSVDFAAVKNEKLESLPNLSLPRVDFPRGRHQIRINEWGPYNFEYPILWLNNIDSNGMYHFEILGKPGKWKLKASNGFSILKSGSGDFPSMLLAKADYSIQNRFIQLVYSGPAFSDMFGEIHAANKQYIFEYREFDTKAIWHINFYSWNRASDPNKDYSSFAASLTKPVFSTTAKKVDYTWWGSIGKKLPTDSFATVATTTMELPSAGYEIGITADDLVRLYVDGKLVIDAWDKSYTQLDENTNHSIRLHLTSGKHDFKIVHADNAGLASLMFYIRPMSAPLNEERGSE